MGKINYANIKAFAHKSFFSGFEDSHVFIKASTGENYSNCGGIYDEKDCTLVADGLVYRTWLNKFMPDQAENFKNTGILFNVNGVCHTYAMRELLFCVNPKDIYVAAGEELCMLYYGMYGCGLKYLEQRLRESFDATKAEENIPDAALQASIARIYDTADIETEAWIKAMKMYLQIDVISFFRQETDLTFLKNRIKELISSRELLFDACFNDSERTLDYSFLSKKKELYIEHFSKYMQDLEHLSYITEEQRVKFCVDFKTILEAHTAYFAQIAKQYNIA